MHCKSGVEWTCLPSTFEKKLLTFFSTERALVKVVSVDKVLLKCVNRDNSFRMCDVKNKEAVINEWYFKTLTTFWLFEYVYQGYSIYSPPTEHIFYWIVIYIVILLLLLHFPWLFMHSLKWKCCHLNEILVTAASVEYFVKRTLLFQCLRSFLIHPYFMPSLVTFLACEHLFLLKCFASV